MSEVTRILSQVEQGDPHAAQQLLPLVYEELRRLAAAKLAHEKPGHTLQGTALVHEAYVRLIGGGDQNWNSRGHFFAAAAEAMRRILTEAARHKHRQKRGGNQRRIQLDEVATLSADNEPDDELLALDEALAQLAAEDPPKAELVKLRYFAGLTIEEASQALGISIATAKRHWIYARAWLYGKLAGE